MKASRIFVVILIVTISLGAVIVSLVSAGELAQRDDIPDGDLTSEELAEIEADRNHDPIMAEAPISPFATTILTCTDGIPTNFYFSDLETNDGGWVESGFGDWEIGTIFTGVYQTCDTSPRPEPNGAYSGVNAWATNLDGCYANSGASNTISQTFDLSELSAPITLDWWHWYEVFETFDFAKVFVNGDELWRTPGSAATVDWLNESIDLSPYAGNDSVTIEYVLNTTTVVNRMGWYLDDIGISFCEPIQPQIILTKTVGTDPNTCAITDTISIPLSGGGTAVTYCYEVQNTGNISLTSHSLVDDQLGQILNNFPFNLEPDASAFLTSTATITLTTINSATWSASNNGVNASASDTATVDVIAPYKTFLPINLRNE